MERGPAWKAKRTILILAIIWAALTIIMPLTLPPNSVGDLSGKVGIMDNDFSSLHPLAKAVYYLGDMNCHTMAERSYELNGNQMPFCARDIGLFLGLALGMAVTLWLRPRFSWLIIILLALPIFVDGGAQILISYESTNLIRIITGILGGIATALFLGHLADVMLSIKK